MLLALALVAAACSSSAASGPKPQDPVPHAEPVGHAGRWLTDSTGRVVIVHGVNMVAKRTPYDPAHEGFGDDDARFLAANGFNGVRLGVIYKAVEPQPGVYDDDYIDRIGAIVERLARYGIRSLLDFHQDAYNEVFAGEGFPDWTVPPENRGPFPSQAQREDAMKKTIDAFWLRAPGPGGVSVQDRYVAAVAHVAERFKTNGYVLGYDIINEPLPGTHAPECVSVPPNCSTFDRMLGGFYQRVIAAIRRVDPTHLVWYEPNTLFNWGLATAIPKLDDPRLAMSYHAYCPSPAACDLSVPIQNGERRAEQTGDAIMLTEFGGQHLPEMTSVIAAARPTFTSWLVWAYCGCRDPTGAVPPEAQGFVENPHKSPAGRNVDDRKLRILAEPYPRAVAGTPTRLSFDPKSKVFELSYTVRRADGAGAFQAGACTDIVVPRVHYPKGYNATVAGATRISKRDAGTLRLRATGAATDVTVRIVPATDGRTDMPVVSDDCAPPR